MTIGSQADKVHEIESYDHLVTPGFAPLAEFAGFGPYEAVAVQETGMHISDLIGRIPAEISRYLMKRPE